MSDTHTKEAYMDDGVRMCIDRVLPIELSLMSRGVAIRENPGNYVPTRRRFRGAVEHRKLWQPGRILKIRFLDGDPTVQQKVAAVAQEWTQYANLKFDFGDHADAEIRISFRHSGSWSYIGTDALTIPRTRPTMNFGWLRPNTNDTEYGRVVIHEFGHALGMVHEHQNPATTIPWNKEAVYEYYSGPPNNWDRATVNRNLFQTYSRDDTNFSEFDPDSIMLYPIQNRFTIGDFEVSWNRTLSETDKAFMRQQYPFDDRLENEIEVDGDFVEESISSVGELDIFHIRIKEANRYRIETHGRSDMVMSLFGPDDDTLFLDEDDDSGRRLNSRIIMALTPGVYTVHVRHYSPEKTGDYKISVRTEA